MNHTIQIEGLPEGWDAVAYRKISYKEDVYIWLPTHGQPFKSNDNFWNQYVFVVQKKFKPRRKVLEEISRQEYYRLFYDESSAKIYDMAGSYWKEIKEE